MNVDFWDEVKILFNAPLSVASACASSTGSSNVSTSSSVSSTALNSVSTPNSVELLVSNSTNHVVEPVPMEEVPSETPSDTPPVEQNDKGPLELNV